MANSSGPAAKLFNHWYLANGPRPNGLALAALGVLSSAYRLLLGLKPAAPARRSAPPKVIAIGNLIVGGAGKTPATIALARQAIELGHRVGIISRGYKSAAEHGPGILIQPDTLASVKPKDVGDEAWLMAWHTRSMVAVCKDRARGLGLLLQADPSIDLVLLDDGLSQRTLGWTKSVLVLDERGFGNRHCLPYGPLREPVGQLSRFDAWIDNGFASSRGPRVVAGEGLSDLHAPLLQQETAWIALDCWQDPSSWMALHEGIGRFKGQRILAVAGIAVPQRFFDTLSQLGIEHTALAAPDHDTQLVDKVIRACATSAYDAVLMTEKDAVKFFHEPARPACPLFALRRESTLDQSFVKRLLDGSETA